MKIFKTMINPGPPVMYSAGFRAMIEDHITWLRQAQGTTSIAVEPNIAFKHTGDFYGLLTHYQVLPEFHWIVMRINHYLSPQDYHHDTLSFIKPDETVMTRLRNMYQSQTTIRK